MKCPKCGYLGFEPVDRCRNCGYEFSLSAPAAPLDLPIRTAADETQQLHDLILIDEAAASQSAPTSPPAGRENRAAGDLERVLRSVPVSAAPELPLFGPSIGDDLPLITRASPPRQPLAVRRATPDVPRGRSETLRASSLDLGFEPSQAPPASQPAAGAQDLAWGEYSGDSAEEAGLGARLAAVLVDLAVLGAVDAVVVYFTLQICGLTIQDLDIIPKAPLLAFLFVQNGGYLVAFTAGGQTLGKMAAGIRVVSDGSGTSLDFGRALLRTILWLLLASPAGLGFLTACFGRDHRGLHDRFARTRVVRASAV